MMHLTDQERNTLWAVALGLVKWVFDADADVVWMMGDINVTDTITSLENLYLVEEDIWDEVVRITDQGREQL